MAAVWLEAALNGPWSRAVQPGIPITVADIVSEGIACAEAGAAIIHVHAYDAASGRQNDDPDTYVAIIEGIRARVGAIVYPTLPLAGSPDSPDLLTPEARFAAVAVLAARGLLEWTVVDPGSAAFARFDAIAEDREGFTYLNPESHIRHGLALCAEHGIHPGYAIYEPGFLRLGAALAGRYAGLPQPVYRFMFSDAFAFGYPPADYALDSYLRLMRDTAPDAPWMVAGLGVDIRPLIAPAVVRGGHVRVGLEDAPFGSDWSNARWVEDAAARIANAGAEPATAAEVRTVLANDRARPDLPAPPDPAR
jgi:uncharacterized protein (DUF849 family)